jgi:hypothetical protein
METTETATSRKADFMCPHSYANAPSNLPQRRSVLADLTDCRERSQDTEILGLGISVELATVSDDNHGPGSREPRALVDV